MANLNPSAQPRNAYESAQLKRAELAAYIASLETSRKGQKLLDDLTALWELCIPDNAKPSPPEGAAPTHAPNRIPKEESDA